MNDRHYVIERADGTHTRVRGNSYRFEDGTLKVDVYEDGRDRLLIAFAAGMWVSIANERLMRDYEN